MRQTDAPPRRRRGRALEEQILEAAWAELDQSGWQGFTMEAVARRSGASKPSIYRRWPDRVALAEAAAQHFALTAPQPGLATGTLQENLTAALHATGGFLTGPLGEAARAMRSRPSRTPAEIGALWWQAPIKYLCDIQQGARERGELGDAPIPIRVTNLGVALVTDQCLLTGVAPTEEEVDEIVNVIWIPLLLATSTSSTGTDR